MYYALVLSQKMAGRSMSVFSNWFNNNNVIRNTDNLNSEMCQIDRKSLWIICHRFVVELANVTTQIQLCFQEQRPETMHALGNYFQNSNHFEIEYSVKKTVKTTADRIRNSSGNSTVDLQPWQSKYTDIHKGREGERMTLANVYRSRQKHNLN